MVTGAAWWRMHQPPVNRQEIMTFTNQFNNIMARGTSLIQSLDLIAQQQQNPYFKQVLMQVEARVASGYPLSRAMAEHPEVFGQNYLAAVRQGELNGNLDIVLQQLSQKLEKQGL